MNHGTKVELLQDARATLFPIEWEEPFGLVMIESMACGTPVIATRHGAVPEVIEDGRAGIIVDDYREMPAALERADAIDPLECRRYVEERFAPERMVADYDRAYEQAIALTDELAARAGLTTARRLGKERRWRTVTACSPGSASAAPWATRFADEFRYSMTATARAAVPRPAPPSRPWRGSSATGSRSRTAPRS